ncbi:hypothetical protein D3C87_511450 [compost metagenome]
MVILNETTNYSFSLYTKNKSKVFKKCLPQLTSANEHLLCLDSPGASSNALKDELGP